MKRILSILTVLFGFQFTNAFKEEQYLKRMLVKIRGEKYGYPWELKHHGLVAEDFEDTMNMKLSGESQAVMEEYTGAVNVNRTVGDGIEINQNYGLNCGEINSDRIVGGSYIDQHRAPWQAFFSISNNGQHYYCGATLVGRYHALSSADCCNQVTDQSKSGLIFGISRINSWSKENVDPNNWYSIAGMLVHDDFSSGWADGNMEHNICIIKLNEAVVTNGDVFPACLPTKNTCLSEGSGDLTVTGYGYQEDQGQQYPILNELNVPIVKGDSCKWIYSGSDREYVGDTELCAGGLENEGACEGDVGGPLMRIDDIGIGTLVGIFSWVKGGCSQEMFPGVYTCVVSHLDWITENTGIGLPEERSSGYCEESSPKISASATDGHCVTKGMDDQTFREHVPVTTSEDCPNNIVSEWHLHGKQVSSAGFQDRFCWTHHRGYDGRINMMACTRDSSQRFEFDRQTGQFYLSDQKRNMVVHYRISGGSSLRVIPFVPRTWGSQNGLIDEYTNTIRLERGFELFASLEGDSLCIEATTIGKTLTLVPCRNDGTDTEWSMDEAGRISTLFKRRDACMVFSGPISGTKYMKLQYCSEADPGRMLFTWNNKVRYIERVAEDGMRRQCVAVGPGVERQKLMFKPCGLHSRFEM